MINDLNNRFEYHRPTTERADLHAEIRTEAWALAKYLVAVLPDCRETSLAITKVEEAMFWANAAVARQ